MDPHAARASIRTGCLAWNTRLADSIPAARADHAFSLRGRLERNSWWSGVKFDDLLRAYPPPANAKWARVDSSVNLDADGNPDPYYASIDLATAQHPQTLLATHYNGQPLEVEHGAPLRLLAPVKLGLKNVKAITRITYSAEEPRDYWAERGYSRYDGLNLFFCGLLQFACCFIDRRGVIIESFSHPRDFVLGIGIAVLFNSLPHARHGLCAVARVIAGRVNHAFKPRASRQPLRVR